MTLGRNRKKSTSLDEVETRSLTTEDRVQGTKDVLAELIKLQEQLQSELNGPREALPQGECEDLGPRRSRRISSSSSDICREANTREIGNPTNNLATNQTSTPGASATASSRKQAQIDCGQISELLKEKRSTEKGVGNERIYMEQQQNQY